MKTDKSDKNSLKIIIIIIVNQASEIKLEGLCDWAISDKYQREDECTTSD